MKMDYFEIPIKVKLPDDWAAKVAQNLIDRGDYVEVVRCEDCKFYSNGQCCNVRHERHVQPVWQLPDDFCNYGVKKEK